MMKAQIRVLGIDDGHFSKKDENVMVVGSVMRRDYIEGLLSTQVKRDGTDATQKIIAMTKKSRFYPQLHCIMTQGTVVAGLNPLNIRKIYEKTRIPVIAALREIPDAASFSRALSKLSHSQKVRKELSSNGRLMGYKGIYYYCSGMVPWKAELMLKHTTLNGNIPEPLRIAHIVASGVTKGESAKRV